MTQHSRKPALLILAVLLGCGGAIVWKSGNASASGAGTNSVLASLEVKIAGGSATRETWLTYGDCLMDASRFSPAAAAYHKVLDLEPFNRPARIGYALALVRGNDVDGLYSFLHQLAVQDPKLTINLLERREWQGVAQQPRFLGLYQEAKAQAAD
jgi:hypothetical protein